MDEAGFRLNLENCKFARTRTEWLGFVLSGSGIRPTEEKIHAITDKLEPTNLKECRSFIGAVNQLYRFIPILAELCAPVHPLLSKEKTWEWTEEEDRSKR